MFRICHRSKSDDTENVDEEDLREREAKILLVEIIFFIIFFTLAMCSKFLKIYFQNFKKDFNI